MTTVTPIDPTPLHFQALETWEAFCKPNMLDLPPWGSYPDEIRKQVTWYKLTGKWEDVVTLPDPVLATSVAPANSSPCVAPKARKTRKRGLSMPRTHYDLACLFLEE